MLLSSPPPACSPGLSDNDHDIPKWIGIPDYDCVNNMTDQVNENATSRPGSAQNAPLLKTPSKADQQRLEKIQLLREKQNSDRLKKLEELKTHAAAASKLREEQDTRRRRHFLELSKKDSERRLAAEERRQQLEKERMTVLTARFEKRMTASTISQSRSNDRKYAFGSCTPRLIENMDGFLWKSQYNLNLAPPPGAGTSDNKNGRATSAQDLLAGTRRNMMATSMYYDQTRTTIDNPLVNYTKSNRDDDAGSQSRLYFFCGRRKTDLTPTIPIRRDMQSPRSTTTSGRLSSRSMTRLDKVHNNSGFARTPSPGSSLQQRSKSTNQLFKLTRTELLRQERAKKREGFSSTMSTRPPSSLSTATPSVMTSSVHSGVNVNIRSRPAARKPRPVSVHVTGITSNSPLISADEKRISKIDEKNVQGKKLFEEKLSARKSQNDEKLHTATTPRPRGTAEQKLANANVASPTDDKSSNKKDFLTSTIKRATTPKTKKPEEPKKVPTAATPLSKSQNVVDSNEGKGQSKKKLGENIITSKSVDNSSVIVDSVVTTEEKNSAEEGKSVLISLESSSVSSALAPVIVESVLEKKDNDVGSGDVIVVPNTVVSNEQKVIRNSENNVLNDVSIMDMETQKKPEIEQEQVRINGLSSQEERMVQVESKLVEVNQEANSKKVVSEVIPDKVVVTNNVPEQNGGDVILNINNNNNNNTPGGDNNLSTSTPTTEQNEEVLVPSKPKLSNEQQAKAALAEKRRLAREAQEREAARLEDLARQEEERQRQEAEMAERLLEESKKAEEERLMKAIRERELREEEERKRQIEEENIRLEKEQADKEAAREVERLRLEMEERLRREETERVERRRRVEAIMSRTRVANRKNQDNKQDNLTQEEEDSAPVIPTTKNDPTTIMNLQNNSINNFNNNTTTSTLISFDDNEFNCNNRSVQEGQQQIDGAFRSSGMEGSTSGSAEIHDLLS